MITTNTNQIREFLEENFSEVNDSNQMTIYDLQEVTE